MHRLRCDLYGEPRVSEPPTVFAATASRAPAMKPKRETWHALYEATVRNQLRLGYRREDAERQAGEFVRYLLWLELSGYR
jgi:hypothetical protein